MRRVWCGLCVVSCLAMAAPAMAAEDGKFEIAGGYSFLRDPATSQNFQGALASVSGAVTSWLDVVGEIGTDTQKASLPTDVPQHVHAFVAGPRYIVRPIRRVALFGQVLVGAAVSNAVVDNIESSGTHLAIQPGGGVDIGVLAKWAVRFEGNFRAIRNSGTTIKEEHFVTSLVFRL
ncbi:MAG TPA: hypothetical protein VGZ27_13230 [Vicinamibacterales bacterium]|nr:hypothetical protein [Vicinamibacterales bacterium]